MSQAKARDDMSLQEQTECSKKGRPPATGACSGVDAAQHSVATALRTAQQLPGWNCLPPHQRKEEPQCCS